jgi:hypothetical protein
MVHLRSPTGIVSDADGRIRALFRGGFCALMVRRTGDRIEGWFCTDGPMVLEVWPNSDEPPAEEAILVVPPADDGPRAAAADRSPIGFARRTVMTDERGDPASVEWAILEPAEFETTLAACGGAPVPAKESPQPMVRVEEFYDADGALSHTVWAPR